MGLTIVLGRLLFGVSVWLSVTGGDSVMALISGQVLLMVPIRASVCLVVLFRLIAVTDWNLVALDIVRVTFLSAVCLVLAVK